MEPFGVMLRLKLLLPFFLHSLRPTPSALERVPIDVRHDHRNKLKLLETIVLLINLSGITTSDLVLDAI